MNFAKSATLGWPHCYYSKVLEFNGPAQLFATVIWSFLILTLTPVTLYVATIGEVPFDQKWKNVVVLMCMSILNLFYAFGVWYFAGSVLPGLPWYVGCLVLALTLLWVFWLLRESFMKLHNSRSDPEVSTQHVEHNQSPQAQMTPGAIKFHTGPIGNIYIYIYIL